MSLDEQCSNVFAHMRASIAATGRSTDDIVKTTFWLAEDRDCSALNRQWVALFPHAESRPARQAMATQLDGDALIQCDLIAVLDEAADGGRSERHKQIRYDPNQ